MPQVKSPTERGLSARCTRVRYEMKGRPRIVTSGKGDIPAWLIANPAEDQSKTSAVPPDPSKDASIMFGMDSRVIRKPQRSGVGISGIVQVDPVMPSHLLHSDFKRH